MVCFGFLFWKTTCVIHDSEMYQFVMSYIMWNHNIFVSCHHGCELYSRWNWRDIEVAIRPGQDNISVCTCTRFCLRETGRNACPHRSTWQLPSSTRNLKLAHEHSVCCRKLFPKMTRYLSLLHFSHVEKFSYSSKQALYFINYLCFSLQSIMWGLQTIQGWACTVRTGNRLKG